MPVPIPVPIPDPVIPVVPTVPGPPTEVSAPAPTPAVAPVASTPQPTPQPKPERSAEPAQQNAAAFAPAVLIPGLPGVPADAKAALAAWNPAEHPKQVLGIGVAAFTMLNLVGPAGLALSSMAGVGVAAAAGAGAAVVAKTESRPKKGSKKGGSVKAAKVKYEKFSAEGSGVGDQSATWRIPGWEKADAWSLAVPIWLATRSPLTARILADGAYVRAMFGSAWLIGPLAGLALGMTAAHQSGGMAVPPTFALTAILLVLAIFDASWGAAGVLGFLVGMAIWPSGQLGAATQMRSFLGLAALWFAIPLIAAASRPFRRSTVSGTTYAWDRLGDAVIATLIAGWAVQKTVGGLPGLSGLDLPIAGDANKLALLAMIAVVVRVFIEEFAAWRYPLRLGAVAKGKLPFAGNRQRLLATGLRTVLFVFLAIAFIGNCWQLWVGAMLFVVPQILSIYERNFPNSPRLKALLPAGILKTLIMLIVGSYFAKLVFSILTDPDSMLRNGFLLMSLPGLALSLVGLFGHDGPDPAWTWPRQLLGGVILAATVGLVLSGW